MFPVPKDLQRLAAEIDGWLELRCPDKALERLPPLLDRADARPVGLALRVRAYTFTKRNEDALADLDELRATAYDPDWLDLTEAWCRKRLPDLPGALRCMQQLLQRNPKSAIGHFNLGCYLALSGDRERALEEVTLACGLEQVFRQMLTDEPDLDSLQSDPRFQQLVLRNGSSAPEPSEEAALAEDVLGGFAGDDVVFEDDPDDEHDDEHDDEPEPGSH